MIKQILKWFNNDQTKPTPKELQTPRVIPEIEKMAVELCKNAANNGKVFNGSKDGHPGTMFEYNGSTVFHANSFAVMWVNDFKMNTFDMTTWYAINDIKKEYNKKCKDQQQMETEKAIKQSLGME